ncbi:hypothetical protein D3C76_1078400 [compost metagenome]
MRQDTPSTARWWITSSRRCSPSTSPWTARSRGPWARSRLPWARSHSACQVSPWRASNCQSRSSPGACSSKCACHSPCGAWNRRRRASWAATRACRARRRWDGSGARRALSITDWFQRCASGMAWAKNCCCIGSSRLLPRAGRCVAWACCTWVCATCARVRTVWWLNRSLGLKCRPSRRPWLTSWMDTIESPPSSKKLSSMPTWSRLSTRCQSCTRRACSSFSAAL